MVSPHRTASPPGGPDRFNALCAGVEEWEPLPELAPTPPEEPTRASGPEQPDDPLDLQILAGLVSPC